MITFILEIILSKAADIFRLYSGSKIYCTLKKVGFNIDVLKFTHWPLSVFMFECVRQ